MKEWVWEIPDRWTTLLSEVSNRPAVSSWQQLVVPPTPIDAMLGLIAKYYNQYRRASPHLFTSIENWKLNRPGMLTDYLLDLYLGGHYNVDAEDLENTMIWEQSGIDWQAWGKQPSSMLVPVVLKEPRTSAVGTGSFCCPKSYRSNVPRAVLLAW